MSVRRRDKRVELVLLGVFVAAFLFAFLNGRFKDNQGVDAASLANFDPGYIISDYQMGNYNSMSEAEIQKFLTSKNPCGNTNYGYYQQLSVNKNYTWHWANSHFVCLSEERFGDGETIGSGDTAAHIIWQAAQDYKINPQVLIVLLQKETGLITDPIPNNGDYRKATGYGCPDTAACSSKYYGFKNQVRNAAALFRTVLDGGWTNYPLGNNYIQYNPNAACGGSVVNIRSLATSALYRYTPYQPNAGALAAGYGTASCGAYGNRNFYLYFEDWFGGITHSNVVWQEMKTPRVMSIIQPTLVIDAKTHSTTGEWLYEGENYYFTEKTQIYWGDGQKICLKRKSDVDTSRCVLMDRMSEFSLEDRMIGNDSLKKYEAVRWTCIVRLYDQEAECDRKAFNRGDKIDIVGEININRKNYLVVDGEGKKYAVLSERVQMSYNFEPMSTVLMKLKSNSYKYLIGKNNRVQFLTTAENPLITVSQKIIIDGRRYYRTAHDVLNMNNYVIPEEALSSDVFSDFIFPRNLTTREEAVSVDLATGDVCNVYKKGVTRRYGKKINYKGVDYYQNKNEFGTQCAIKASYLEEARYTFNNDKISFAPFLFPRKLIMSRSAYLINMGDGTTCDEYLEIGDIQRYITKIEFGGELFYRSEENTVNGSNCVMPSANLSEI